MNIKPLIINLGILVFLPAQHTQPDSTLSKKPKQDDYEWFNDLLLPMLTNVSDYNSS